MSSPRCISVLTVGTTADKTTTVPSNENFVVSSRPLGTGPTR
jgi:hypothetical protein